MKPIQRYCSRRPRTPIHKAVGKQLLFLVLSRGLLGDATRTAFQDLPRRRLHVWSAACRLSFNVCTHGSQSCEETAKTAMTFHKLYMNIYDIYWWSWSYDGITIMVNNHNLVHLSGDEKPHFRDLRWPGLAVTIRGMILSKIWKRLRIAEDAEHYGWERDSYKIIPNLYIKGSIYIYT